MRDEIGFVSDWHSLATKDKLSEILCPGDLVEFKREIYNHWAVCVTLGPNPLIVHRTSDDSGFLNPSTVASKSLNKGKYGIGRIDAEELWDVLGGSKVRINNSNDQKRRPKAVEEIVMTALQSVQSDFNGCYNVIKNNCEHFATHCRYGRSVSSQVIHGTVTAFAAVFAVIVGFGFVVLKSIR